MKTHIGSLFVAAAALAALFVSPLRAVDVGQPAPDFKLTDLDGNARSLSDYRGKTVVLEWNNPDCPIVRKHYDSGNIPTLQRDATADGVVWLMINSGAPGQQGADYSTPDLKSLLKKYDAAPTAYFRDQDGNVGHLYSAKTTPHLYIIDPKGTLMYQGAIDSIPSANQADIAKATNYVRDALGAMKAGKPIQNTATKPYGCSVKY